MQSGLINKDGKIISCFYYEIEDLCKKIIEKYCKENEEKQNIFLEFAKKYTFFNPNFDFVVGVLGYSLLNPWFLKNKILCGNYENQRYFLKGYSEILGIYSPYKFNSEIIGFSSDYQLKVKPFIQENNFYNCFITPDLYELVPCVKGHRELAQQILNLGMIHDKELCKEIIKIDFLNTDAAEVLMWYFPLLRFDCYDDENSFMLVYRSDNISFEQEDLRKKLEKLNCDKFIADQSLNSIAKTYDWSMKLYKKERRSENENQRL